MKFLSREWVIYIISYKIVQNFTAVRIFSQKFRQINVFLINELLYELIWWKNLCGMAAQCGKMKNSLSPKKNIVKSAN